MNNAIEHARANGLLTEAAASAPDDAICTACYGTGERETEDSWPTPSAIVRCDTCFGTGIKRGHGVTGPSPKREA